MAKSPKASEKGRGKTRVDASPLALGSRAARSHLREMAARSFKARCGVTLALLGLLALARGAPLPPRPNVRCGTRFHRAPPLSRAVFCSRIHATNVCFFLPLIAGRLEDCCAVVKVKEPETTLRRLPPLEAARG